MFSMSVLRRQPCGTGCTNPDKEVVMKRTPFKLSPLALSITLALPIAFGSSVATAEPYPALPPTLSNSVTPNVLLHIDNSGSMGSRPPGATRGDTKMQIAKSVAKSLISNNPGLRWGIFSFDPNSSETAGILRAPIGSSLATLNSTIDDFSAKTWTPLGEAMLEITRYFSGDTSYYSKTSNLTNSRYTSPIQYRCQKNFAIVITDGVSTKDDRLPGIGSRAALSYTSYNSSGDSVNKTFRVCSNTSTVSDISCPARLEGSSVNNPFVGTSDDSASYGRSIRDVAMYAYDMDMRVGGTDLDGKSFDEARFKKQNLTTYTVGFAVDDPVLQAAAIVGGGKYYTSTDQSTLTAALSSAVNDIIASVSNAGGVATRSEILSTANNKALQPVFNPKGWYGELRCKTLDNKGKVSGDCSIPKAIIPPASGRKIYTSQVTSTGINAFDFTTTNLSLMSTTQQAGLGGTVTERQNTINWIRGVDVAGLRTRPDGKLGDMIDAQPTIIGESTGYTPDADYAAFKASTQAREASSGIPARSARNLALIGANDGMMHAFDIDTMTELMGYVPHAVYRNLKSLPKTDYGQSGGTPHAFFVNGNSRREDVKIGGSWKTILAGGLGQGGQGYFALDVTSAAALTDGATSAVKWEWNDQRDAQIGYSFGTPIIYNVRTSATAVTPAVIFSNGYENDFNDTASGGQRTTAKSSALFVVNASTGALIQKIEVTGGSGLSSPAGWDHDSDGILDYVYAGDINGKVWRFDLTSANFSVSSNPLFDAGTAQPIVQRPGLYPTGTAGQVMVVFGSGKILTDADRTDNSPQALYGVLDTFTSNVSTAAKASLVQQTIESTYTMSTAGKRAGTYRKMSGNTVELGLHRGWYIDLPAGERLLTSPMVYADKVLMGTGSVQSGEVCQPGGKGWIMGLNPLTGSTPKSARGREFSFVDIDGDGKSTTADQIPFASGSSFAAGYDRAGMPTELSFVSENAAILEFTAATDGTYPGSTIALRESNAMGVFRSDRNNSTRYLAAGKGTLVSGTIGNDTIDEDPILGPSSGVRVETGTWKELAN